MAEKTSATNNENKTAPLEAVVVEADSAPVGGSGKRWNVGKLFWGLLIILIGVLLLLDNLDIINVNLGALWQLWPIAIIGIGVSMLSLRGWLAGLIAGLLIVLTLVAVLLVTTDNSFINRIDDATQSTQSQTVEKSDGTREGDVVVKTGAGELNFASTDSPEIIANAKLDSDGFELNKSSEVRGGIQFVEFNIDAQRRVWLGHVDNNLNVDLTQSLPLSLTVNTGASRVRGDLSEVQLKRTVVKAGASSIDLKFGAKQKSQEVNIEAGASSVVLQIPRSSGVRVNTNNGLTDNKFQDIPNVSDGLYESSDFDTAENTITITTKLGVSSFEIVRY